MCGQIAGSLHDAELHLVHTREDSDGTESELLVVGVLLDANEHGWNVGVSLRAIHYGTYNRGEYQIAHDAFVLGLCLPPIRSIRTQHLWT